MQAGRLSRFAVSCRATGGSDFLESSCCCGAFAIVLREAEAPGKMDDAAAAVQGHITALGGREWESSDAEALKARWDPPLTCQPLSSSLLCCYNCKAGAGKQDRSFRLRLGLDRLGLKGLRATHILL